MILHIYRCAYLIIWNTFITQIDDLLSSGDAYGGKCHEGGGDGDDDPVR